MAAALPSLLTLDEAADVLRCSRKTVQRRISEGALPVVRIGRTCRVNEDDLRKFIRASTHSHKPTSGPYSPSGIVYKPGARLSD